MADFTDGIEVAQPPIVTASPWPTPGSTVVIFTSDQEPVTPVVPDVTPPVVSNFNPPPGSVITTSQPVEFDVTDDSGTFARIFVVAWFKDTGIQEVIHDGDGFVGFYSAASSRVPITDGFRYTTLRSGGWPSSPTIRVFPIDSSGNE